MSDQTQSAPAFQQAGQPAGTAEPAPEFLTRADFEKRAKEIEENAFRRSQSLIEKSNSKVRSAIQELEKTIDSQRKLGVQITDAQAEQLKQQAVAKVLSADPEPSASAPGSAPSQQSQVEDPNRWAQETSKLYPGVTIEDSDPEAAPILQAIQAQDLQAYKRAVLAGFVAKTARLAINPPTTVAPASPLPSPRLPTSLGAGGSVASTSAEALTAQLVELQKHPTKNAQAIQKVTAELESKLKSR